MHEQGIIFEIFFNDTQASRFQQVSLNAFCQAKVKCQYCQKLFLERKLAMHLHYFCGPDSKRTVKQKLRDRQSKDGGIDSLSTATKRGMETLKIGHQQSLNNAARAPSTTQKNTTSRAKPKRGLRKNKSSDKRKLSTLTPSGIYRSLMEEAGRPVQSRWGKPVENIDGISEKMPSDDEKKTILTRQDDDHPFAKGQQIECRWQGGEEFYSGRITRVYKRLKKYDIKYDDGDKESKVEFKFVRQIQHNKALHANVNSNTELTSGIGHPGLKLSEFKLGDRVECCWHGGSKFFPGKIIQLCKGGLYTIAFDDGKRETSIHAKNIRLITTVKANEIKIEDAAHEHKRAHGRTGKSKEQMQTSDLTSKSSSNYDPKSRQRLRRSGRKCAICNKSSGALLFCSGQLMCMPCVDKRSSIRTSQTHLAAVNQNKRRLSLSQKQRRTPRIVDLEAQSSSDEWLPPSNKKRNKTSKTNANLSTPSKKQMRGKNSHRKASRRRKKNGSQIDSVTNDVSISPSGGPIDGHSSAEDDDKLSWCLDDQEGVDLRTSTLHRVKWKRIILDEAHKIKVQLARTSFLEY